MQGIVLKDCRGNRSQGKPLRVKLITYCIHFLLGIIPARGLNFPTEFLARPQPRNMRQLFPYKTRNMISLTVFANRE